MKQVVKILQLTDLHLFGDQQLRLVDINPFQTLQQITNKILQETPSKTPDLIVVTGDISQDYSLPSYKLALATLQQFSCPIVATMGNHDQLIPFTKIFGAPTQIVTNIATNWKIILLNSCWPKHVGGRLPQLELNFLKKSLAESKEQPVILFLHHHVIPVGSAWLDKLMVQNSSQLLTIITQYPNVKAVVCGHVHQDTSILHKNIIFLSTPATSWQFATKSCEFKLDVIMPGYRWLDLYEDGTIHTEVVRIPPNAAFIPNTASTGY